MKTRKHRSSRLQKVPERTILLFSPHVPPHFSLTAFILFTAFPEILAYHRSIFLECVYQNDYENDERYCQANYDEHQFLRTKYRELPSLVDITHRSCVEERERQREPLKENCVSSSTTRKRKRKKKKHSFGHRTVHRTCIRVYYG